MILSAQGINYQYSTFNIELNIIAPWQQINKPYLFVGNPVSSATGSRHQLGCQSSSQVLWWPLDRDISRSLKYFKYVGQKDRIVIQWWLYRIYHMVPIKASTVTTVWISNYIRVKQRDFITHPCPQLNFNQTTENYGYNNLLICRASWCLCYLLPMMRTVPGFRYLYSTFNT